MAHLLVQNNSINDGQSGAFVDIANPLTEIWVDFELVVTGTLPGEPTVDWQGEWDEGTTYPADAYVFHNGYSWRAPVDMEAGDEPGVPAFNDVLNIIRGVGVFDYDRVNNTSPEVRSFPDDADYTNIAGRPARVVLVDKTGTSGHDMTLKNLHPDQEMSCAFNDANDNYQMLSFPAIMPGEEETLTLPSSSVDLYGVIWFGGGVDVDSGGSFEVSLTNVGTLVPPTPIKQNWELVGRGTRGPAAPNLIEFYGFRPFSFDRLPPPVPPEPVPEPEPEPEPGDEGVVPIDFPAGSNTDGRSWEIHFTLATGGTFTVAHSCTTDGVFLFYDGSDNTADPTIGLGPFPGLPPGDYIVYVNSPTDAERSCAIEIVLTDGATFSDPSGAPVLIDTYVPPEWGETYGKWNYDTEQVQDSTFSQNSFRKDADDFADVTKLWFANRNTDGTIMGSTLDGLTTGDQVRLLYPPSGAPDAGTELDAIYTLTANATFIDPFEEIGRAELTVTADSVTWNGTDNFGQPHELRVIT